MTVIHRNRNSGRTARLTALGMLVLVAGCSEQRVVPPHRPAPSPVVAPVPVPAPPQTDWRRAPATPGNWVWSNEAGRSTARFAGGLVVLRCDRASSSVILSRAARSSAPDPAAITIRTSALTKSLAAAADRGPPASLSVRIPASDPLLDAMALSRGRFALETGGEPALYVPSWTEVSRVVEDCR